MHEDLFDRSIDVQILRLRRKLESDRSAPRIIQTERGVGYAAILILVFCLWQAFVTCSAARWAGSGRGSAHGGIGGGFAKARVSSRSSHDGKIR